MIKGSKKGKTGVAAPVRPTAEIYARARAAGQPIKEAKKLAGFSENYHTGKLEASKAYKRAIKSIEEEREELRHKAGFRLSDVATRAKEIATAKVVTEEGQKEYAECARDRLAADKQLISLLNYEPTKQVQVSHKGLFLEFTGLSSDDLRFLQTCTADTPELLESIL
jgi:hypothetical protein